MNYLGTKSLDAEIYIDLVKGEVTMDYSSNEKHNPYDSNSSSVNDDSNEFVNLPWYKRLFWAVFQTVNVLFYMIVGLEMGVATRLQQSKHFPESWHYPYQNWLKFYTQNFEGVFEETFEGELSGTVLQVPIDHNIWFSWGLSGDYEKYITNISFERRIRKFRKFNNYTTFVQDGWMLTFEFIQPPKEGMVKVEYV